MFCQVQYGVCVCLRRVYIPIEFSLGPWQRGAVVEFLGPSLKTL